MPSYRFLRPVSTPLLALALAAPPAWGLDSGLPALPDAAAFRELLAEQTAPPAVVVAGEPAAKPRRRTRELEGFYRSLGRSWGGLGGLRDAFRPQDR